MNLEAMSCPKVLVEGGHCGVRLVAQDALSEAILIVILCSMKSQKRQLNTY